MDRNGKFEEDLGVLTARLSEGLQHDEKQSLDILKNRLLELQKSSIVKINHSVMELVCVKQLLQKGYQVQVEYEIEPNLTCDVYSAKGDGSHIIEIETGFIPPEHALDPSRYLLARIASKVTRYSNHTEKFALGTPPHYVLPVPQTLLTVPRSRSSEELNEIKTLCDLYYKNPSVTMEEVRNARLHSVYVIDVDSLTAKEIDPESYVKGRSPQKTE